MPFYRKKPVTIEAVQWTGDNTLEAGQFMGMSPDFSAKRVYGKIILLIPTLEGVMEASVGDYIIKGIKGEFYPCKPDIFAASYEQTMPPQYVAVDHGEQ